MIDASDFGSESGKVREKTFQIYNRQLNGLDLNSFGCGELPRLGLDITIDLVKIEFINLKIRYRCIHSKYLVKSRPTTSSSTVLSIVFTITN